MEDTPRDRLKRAHDELSALLDNIHTLSIEDAADRLAYTALRDASRKVSAALEAYWDAEELIGSNPRVDGQRIAWSDTAWLYPGDEIVLLHGGGK